ncbi:MAG: acyl-CoA dehydrogenase family protein [Candidatus Binatia bacterium]
MDLSYGPEYEAFRAGIRAFLDARAADAPRASISAAEDGPEIRKWQKTLIEHGYTARIVPSEYGGFGAAPDLLETVIINEEFSRAGVSQGMENQGISMFVPTLLTYGTEDQKKRWIGPTIRGEMIWCQGYSEPDAGSDLASLRTRAVLDGDEFVINGQKIWTTSAREAQMMFALVRTEPDASKHAGISYLCLSMDSPGLEVRPLKTMLGTSSFNEVFFEDVRVPRDNLIGKRGQGWEVGTTTLFHERNMLGSSKQTENMLRRCEAVLRDVGGLDDPLYRDRLLRLQGRALAMKYHGLRVLTDRLKGRGSGVAGLITKLNGCQLNHDISALAIDALGEHGVLKRGSKYVREQGNWQNQYMFTLGLIIGGGTAQIQKNIISERGLGMPREPKPAAPQGVR